MNTFRWIAARKQLSPRAFKDELTSQIWFSPLIYAFFSILLAALTLFLDYYCKVGEKVPSFFSINMDLTNTLVSTIMPGILSITTFTFNLMLVVFTSFAAQFSPRVLKNFASSKSTQRILGIFIGSFLYTLFVFLFLNSSQVDGYFAIPFVTTALSVFSAGTFVYFINHSVKWLQVNHMTQSMKTASIKAIKTTIREELEIHRTQSSHNEQFSFPEGEKKPVCIQTSGYIQTLNYSQLIDCAKEHNLVIKMEREVGDYVLSGTVLFYYWHRDSTEHDEMDCTVFHQYIHVGKSQTDIQDTTYIITKFVEMAIKSLGNDDFKTAVNSIHQISDILREICEASQFSSYLVDDNGVIRMVIPDKKFEDFLYDGFANIRHYARRNIIITMELLKTLGNLAEAIGPAYYDDIWEFAVYISKGFEEEYLFVQDKKYFLHILCDLAVSTEKEEQYEQIAKQMKE
ncbi:DUF2254 domain-containing protein [Priestia megaterium]|uniref:DUF2254 domain-containing protein n=1 Tax=Priestia megaterium TaxID=1404 RepID=UPI002DBBA387|nr:DUF2254 domain-containing protein [Priestia megaterium]MEC1069940.1 DUF2254 domain-containing protein [Priestia megaterium]